MNKRVWIFQYKKEVERKETAKASWYVGWYDHDGHRHAESCGPGARGKNSAEKRKRRLQSELDMRLHQPSGKTKWGVFRGEYEASILPKLASRSRDEVRTTLNHFERIVRPGRIRLRRRRSMLSSPPGERSKAKSRGRPWLRPRSTRIFGTLRQRCGWLTIGATCQRSQRSGWFGSPKNWSGLSPRNTSRRSMTKLVLWLGCRRTPDKIMVQQDSGCAGLK